MQVIYSSRVTGLVVSIGAFVLLLGFAGCGGNIEEIKPVPDVCWPRRFPGNSVPVEKVTEQDRSVFIQTDFGSDGKFLLEAFREDEIGERTNRQNQNLPIQTVDEVYRFFWLRSFHNPVVIRIFRSGGEKFLVVKRTDGRGGYQPGRLTEEKTVVLDDNQWCEFLRLLEEADFWNKEKVDVQTLANDGAFWNLEGLREGRYYVAGEQSPPGPEFYEACVYLMRLGGLPVNRDDPDFY